MKEKKAGSWLIILPILSGIVMGVIGSMYGLECSTVRCGGSHSWRSHRRDCAELNITKTEVGRKTRAICSYIENELGRGQSPYPMPDAWRISIADLGLSRVT